MLVLGMMSGTSADGIDVALARISGAPPNLNAKLLGHSSFKFPPALRKEILRVAEQQPISAGRTQPTQLFVWGTFTRTPFFPPAKSFVSPRRVSP